MFLIVLFEAVHEALEPCDPSGRFVPVATAGVMMAGDGRMGRVDDAVDDAVFVKGWMTQATPSRSSSKSSRLVVYVVVV